MPRGAGVARDPRAAGRAGQPTCRSDGNDHRARDQCSDRHPRCGPGRRIPERSRPQGRIRDHGCERALHEPAAAGWRLLRSDGQPQRSRPGSEVLRQDHRRRPALAGADDGRGEEPLHGRHRDGEPRDGRHRLRPGARRRDYWHRAQRRHRCARREGQDHRGPDGPRCRDADRRGWRLSSHRTALRDVRRDGRSANRGAPSGDISSEHDSGPGAGRRTCRGCRRESPGGHRRHRHRAPGRGHDHRARDRQGDGRSDFRRHDHRRARHRNHERERRLLHPRPADRQLHGAQQGAGSVRLHQSALRRCLLLVGQVRPHAGQLRQSYGSRNHHAYRLQAAARCPDIRNGHQRRHRRANR